MKPEEIQEAAKEAGFKVANYESYTEVHPCVLGQNLSVELERFASSIEKRTIERCASALDKVMVTDHSLNTFKRCQAAIRKLGEQ